MLGMTRRYPVPLTGRFAGGIPVGGRRRGQGAGGTGPPFSYAYEGAYRSGDGGRGAGGAQEGPRRADRVPAAAVPGATWMTGAT